MKTINTFIESYLGRFLLWVGIVMLGALLYSQRTASPRTWQAQDWQAFTGIVTASLAVVAAVVAAVQLQEARNLRWEQAMPYVAAYLEPDPTDPKIVYLVIRNFGSTAATDITVAISPPPERSPGVGGGPLTYPSQMPTLVPGQEWRTFWDFSPFRHSSQMTTPHTVAITYLDSRDDRHAVRFLVDWGSFTLGRNWVGRKTVHHVSESLAQIEKHVRRLASTSLGGEGDNQSNLGEFFRVLQEERSVSATEVEDNNNTRSDAEEGSGK